MILRADLHIHSGDDPYDKLPYSVFDAIDTAAARGINCMAITDHLRFSFTKEYADYAKNNNVILLPGIETQINNRDVLIYNSDRNVEKLKSFDELRAFKNDDVLIIAPHPFYPIKYALQNFLFEYSELFDAIEISSCYLHFYDKFNKKARKAARELAKPIVCNSDSHALWQIGNVWTEIDAEDFTVESVIRAIKSGKTKTYCRPMSYFEFFKFFACGDLPRTLRKIFARENE